MQRQISPQLAIAACASVLAMAWFALLGQARPADSAFAPRPHVGMVAQAVELPRAEQFLSPLH